MKGEIRAGNAPELQRAEYPRHGSSRGWAGRRLDRKDPIENPENNRKPQHDTKALQQHKSPL